MLSKLFAAFRWWPNRLLLGLIGVGTGAWAIVRLQDRVDELSLLGIFLITAVILGAGLGWSEPEATLAPRPLQRRGLKALLALLGSAAGLFFLRTALGLFEGAPMYYGSAWSSYWLAVGLVFLCFLPWGGARASERPPIGRLELGLFLAIFALGLAFRAYELRTRPYGIWFDEAQNCLEALKILREPNYRPVFVSGFSQMPALIFYYYSIFVYALGPGVLTMRIATTVVAMAAILVVWLLGRELFGRRVGLLAAALLAVMRWHVNFSRFAISNMVTTFFIPLVLLLFFRSQKRRSPRDAVFAGLSMGIGLQFYYAMFSVPLVMVGAFVLRLFSRQGRSLAAVGLLCLTLGATWFAYAPLLQYASKHQAEFNERMRTVSIIKAGSLREIYELFKNPSQQRDEVVDALKLTFRAHARMFHFQGDSNGRHNLPGAPMLEPVMGALFGIGLIWCLLKLFDSRYAAIVLWFCAMMAAGIFSLAFEAPQGARSFGATAAIALMSALPLARFTSLGSREEPRGWRLWAGGLLGLFIVAATAYQSWTTYFGQQLWNPVAWASFSTIETKIGEVLRDEGKGKVAYIPATLINGPTEAILLDAGRPEMRTFERGRDLPLEPSGQDAIIFFEGNEQQTAETIQRYYPDASIEPFGAPLPGGGMSAPIARIARIPQKDIDAVFGWVTEYRAEGGKPVEVSTRSASWDWSAAPMPPPFRATVRGALRVSHDGIHGLRLRTEVPSVLKLDGEEILRTQETQHAEVSLARGSHEISLEFDVAAAQGASSVTWSGSGIAGEQLIDSKSMVSPKSKIGGLLGSYHQGVGCMGSPVFRQIDPQVEFYFHLLPLSRPFSICWAGNVYAPESGTYSFGTTSIDASKVLIDGELVIHNTQGPGYMEGQVFLDEGWHSLDLRYDNTNNYSQVYLYWTPPGHGRELIPADVLRPLGPSHQTLAPAAPPPLLKWSRSSGDSADPMVSAPALKFVRGVASTLNKPVVVDAAVQGPLAVLDREARQAVFFASAESTPVPLQAVWTDPVDLEFDTSGRLHVLDSAGSIFVFTASGVLEKTLDIRPLGVYNPRGLAVTVAGQIVIADTGGGRILVCDAEARQLFAFGARGTAQGELMDPIDVAVDGKGQFFVVDSGNQRLQRFSEKGEPSGVWPHPAITPGRLSPRLDVDAAGNLWMAGGESIGLWRVSLASSDSIDSFRAPRGKKLQGLTALPNGNLLLSQTSGDLVEAALP